MDVEEAVDRPPRRLAAVVAAVVAIVLIAFVVVLATRDPATDRQSDSPLLGRVAPPLTGQTITSTGARSYDLDLQRGQWVVVNFFATWCTPCITEHPELVEFAERHARTGDASIVSVVFDDRPDNVTDFFEENGGNWPVVDGGDVILNWAVAQVPESFLVDPDGIVRTRITGGVTADGLDALLQEAGGA